MRLKRQLRCLAAIVAGVVMLLTGPLVYSQDASYRLTEGWAQVPNGHEWGALIAVEVDNDDNIYAYPFINYRNEAANVYNDYHNMLM